MLFSGMSRCEVLSSYESFSKLVYSLQEKSWQHPNWQGIKKERRILAGSLLEDTIDLMIFLVPDLFGQHEITQHHNVIM